MNESLPLQPSHQPLLPGSLSTTKLPLWQPVILAAMAGGMGWGIRGQYGHETGAMIAGLLVGLVLAFLFCPQAPSLSAVRAVAFCTVAIGFGGSMTYGQTVGLTHDAPLIGNWSALQWGLLGLGLKGSIWIGFAGVFLGMGLSGVRYRPLELLSLMCGAVVLFFAGTWLLNEPYDPANKILPKIYFSDDWRWEPEGDLKPRRELWGGLLFALAAVIVYAALVRKDRLARSLAFWGMFGGAIGFPLGQCIQAFHAWNRPLFEGGSLGWLWPHINWWNMMETTFGAVFGGTLAFGLWLNRRRVGPLADPPEIKMKTWMEWGLVMVYVSLLLSGEFMDVPVAGRYLDLGLIMGVVPLAAVAGGRWWPYFVILPITVLPIAGKTVRQLCYRETQVAPELGWVIYFVLPVLLTGAAAIWLGSGNRAGLPAREFLRRTLLLVVWLYFGLNFAFFRFPWPWESWTSRTPNGMIFLICAAGLTLGAWRIGRTNVSSASGASETSAR